MNAQEETYRVTNEDLIEALLDLEDTVPRAMIEECADRGETLAQALIALITDEYAVENDDLHLSPWPRLHAIMILGLSSSDSSGRALVSALKTAAEKQDDFLTGWLAGCWPALLRNKSVSCIAALPRLVDNSKSDLTLRTAGAEVILSFAHRQDEKALDNCLQWIASLAANEAECWEFRLFTAALLLNFPRDEHRTLIEQFAGMEYVEGSMYCEHDVQSAYREMRDTPVWNRFSDPWAFYLPEAIAERSIRWSVELGEKRAPAIPELGK
jgi:hypothetical protein